MTNNTNPMFMTPQALAQAATAALAAAAQQVAAQQATNKSNPQAPQGVMFQPQSHNNSVVNRNEQSASTEAPSSINIPRSLSNNSQQGGGNQPLANPQSTCTNINNTPTAPPGTTAAGPPAPIPLPMNMNMDALNAMLQSAQAFSGNPQQMALNAQAAAVLAASGINPSLILNANNGNNAMNPTIAAAQAIASLVQNQQQQQHAHQQQQQQQPQLHSPHPSHQPQQGPNAPPPQAMGPNTTIPSNTTQQQTTTTSPNNNGDTTTTQKNPSAPTMMQHFNHAPQATVQGPPSSSTPTTAPTSMMKSINKQVVNEMTPTSDTLTTLLSMNAANSNRMKSMNQNVASLLQSGNSTPQPTQQQQQQQQPQQSESNINTLYATASNNPVFFAQMQNWKLDQLGEHSMFMEKYNHIFFLLTSAFFSLKLET